MPCLGLELISWPFNIWSSCSSLIVIYDWFLFELLNHVFSIELSITNVKNSATFPSSRLITRPNDCKLVICDELQVNAIPTDNPFTSTPVFKLFGDTMLAILASLKSSNILRFSVFFFWLCKTYALLLKVSASLHVAVNKIHFLSVR